MARYCSAQDNVRTRQSPPYRETIRVNVLHGRKSMSWAKSVLPLFTGTSSETFRKVPDRVQIDTTLNRQNRVQNHPFIGRHRLLNRTAVNLSMRDSCAGGLDDRLVMPPERLHFPCSRPERVRSEANCARSARGAGAARYQG